MYIASAMATTKKVKKNNVTDMIRNEREENHMKHLIKTTNGRKRGQK